MKRILFLTTHNLASNPRLVKEIRLAITNQFETEVICFEFKNWSYDLNLNIKKELEASGVKLHILPAGRVPFLRWLISVLAEASAKILLHLFPCQLFLLAQGISRRTMLLVGALKKVNCPHLVIGHNPGALYPTYLAGKKFKCKTGFDAEDYHPGESNNKKMQRRCKSLMNAILPQFSYVSFASPLIKEAFVKDVNITIKNWIVVMNYFISSDFPKSSVSKSDVIKLVWFSQNISYGRGLELILPVLEIYKAEVELHLIGNMDIAFYDEYLSRYSNVINHKAQPQSILHRNLCGFDIGLALEPSKDINNQLAVSNKMLAYLQAGLFVLATTTPAQVNIQKSFPNHVLLTEYSLDKLLIAVKHLIDTMVNIREKQSERYNKMNNINWESESQQLSKIWNSQVAMIK